MKYKIEVHWLNPKFTEVFELPFECDSEFTNLFLDNLTYHRNAEIEVAYSLIDDLKIGRYE